MMTDVEYSTDCWAGIDIRHLTKHGTDVARIAMRHSNPATEREVARVLNRPHIKLK